MFLEGAEDFDIVSAGHAETVQVKDTASSGTVTLNSPSVIEAMIHFWEHHNNNPSHVVLFRFLTSSCRGLEQSNSFGGVRGLDYWDRCKHPDSTLASLRAFLLAKDSLPSALKNFISDSSDSELRDRLIRRITWDTGQGDHATIKEVIRRQVIGIGADLFSVPPYEAEKIVPLLFTHAFEVARDKGGRQLDVTDFLELLQTHSTIRISRSKLAQHRQAHSAEFTLEDNVGKRRPSTLLAKVQKLTPYHHFIEWLSENRLSRISSGA